MDRTTARCDWDSPAATTRAPARARSSVRLTALVGALALLAASSCHSPSADADAAPLTVEEQEELLRELGERPEIGVIDTPGTLFLSLDQNLRTWREILRSSEVQRVRQLDSVESALGRQVYLNFDTVLEGLQSPDAEHRITAAAALGFARVPSPGQPDYDPRFPPVHERAVDPLVAALESGDDALTRNALVSLARIASEQTPVELLLELLLSHHDPEVRSNAALALSKVLRPADRFKAISPLYAALEDVDAKVRLHAVGAVAALRDASATGQLLVVLQSDESSLVQASAAYALGDLGDVSAVPHLANALLSKTGIVRVASQHSLRKLTGLDLGNHPQDWMGWYAEQKSRSQSGS